MESRRTGGGGKRVACSGAKMQDVGGGCGEDENMKKSTGREKIIRYLERLAFYRPNDSIRMAMEGEGLDIRRLHLEGIAEFKLQANGTVEMKFFDRLKAIELLMELEEDRGELSVGGLQNFLDEVGRGGEA